MKILRIDVCPYGFEVFYEKNISDRAFGFTIHVALGRFAFYQQQHLNLCVALDGAEWRIRKRLNDCSKACNDQEEFTIGLRGGYTINLLFELLGVFVSLQRNEFGIDIRWKGDLDEIKGKVVSFPMRRKNI